MSQPVALAAVQAAPAGWLYVGQCATRATRPQKPPGFVDDAGCSGRVVDKLSAQIVTDSSKVAVRTMAPDGPAGMPRECCSFAKTSPFAPLYPVC